MGHRPRISALPLRIQKADSRKLQQAPRLGAMGRSRGRARQEARLRIRLRDGPRCACCGELIDITPSMPRPFELDHIVPLWQGVEGASGQPAKPVGQLRQ
ncbi:Uncharacterised protein [Delftia tsuruhatensis]|nr:Uncharacterised protein [Delftia tsuruhatensis]CAC9685497.1 Uncharacterised protein [Delftia tsuruhatensis]